MTARDEYRPAAPAGVTARRRRMPVARMLAVACLAVVVLASADCGTLIGSTHPVTILYALVPADHALEEVRVSSYTTTDVLKLHGAPTAILVLNHGLAALVCQRQPDRCDLVDLFRFKSDWHVDVGSDPAALAVDPSDFVAYAADEQSGAVTPIVLPRPQARRPIPVCPQPTGVAVVDEGLLALVACGREGEVERVNVFSRTVTGAPLRVGDDLAAIAAVGQQEAYVVDSAAGDLVPIDTTTFDIGVRIPAGLDPIALALSPDGSRAYVLDDGVPQLLAVDLQSGSALKAVHLPAPPTAVALTPDGKTAFVGLADGLVVTVDLRTWRTRDFARLRHEPDALAVQVVSSKT